MAIVAATPPARSQMGTTVGQPRDWAYIAATTPPRHERGRPAATAATAAARNAPATPPRTERRTDSERNWVRIGPLVAPRARRRPISPRRSSTEMTIALATPRPRTRSAPDG